MIHSRYLFSGAKLSTRHNIRAKKKFFRYKSTFTLPSTVYHHQPYYAELQDFFKKHSIKDVSVTHYIENMVLETIPQKKFSNSELEVWLQEQLKPITSNPHMQFLPLWTLAKQAKQQAQMHLNNEINKLSKDQERCEIILNMTVDEVVQYYTDQAESLVSSVNTQHFLTPWATPQVLGQIKHQTAQQLHRQDQDYLSDYRLHCEVYYYLNHLVEPYRFYSGAVCLDFVTNQKNKKNNEIIVWDSKYGKKGLEKKQLTGILKHGPSHAAVKEVRPSWQGGTTLKWKPKK